MKKNNFFLLLLTSVTLLASSCEKNSDISCGNINFNPINVQTICSIVVQNKQVEDKFLVINSLEELNKNILLEDNVENSNCSDNSKLLNIDFTKYTLLIGKKTLEQTQGSLINQSVERDCNTNSYIYSINIKQGGYTALGNFIFGAIIEKIPTETTVKFNVKVEN